VGLGRVTLRSTWQNTSCCCCLSDCKSGTGLTDQTLVTAESKDRSASSLKDWLGSRERERNPAAQKQKKIPPLFIRCRKPLCRPYERGAV